MNEQETQQLLGLNNLFYSMRRCYREARAEQDSLVFLGKIDEIESMYTSIHDMLHLPRKPLTEENIKNLRLFKAAALELFELSQEFAHTH